MTTQTPDAVREREILIEKLREVEALEDCNMKRHAYAIRTFAKEAADYLAALDSRAGDAGEGWKLVPVEMTREMSDAGRDATGGYPYAPHDIPKLGYMQVNIIWNAILAATPAPAVDAVPAGEVDANWLRGDWYERWQDATENADDELMATLESLKGRVERTILAALSHGEGPK